MLIVFPDGAACVQHDAELDRLRRIGTVEFHERPPRDKPELIERLQAAEAVFLDYSTLDAEVLRQCPRLRFVCFLGIGYASYVDVAEAIRRGIVVTYTPDYGATSVAEHALGLIMAVTRHIGAAFLSMREGHWTPNRFQGIELSGKTLGVVGLGPIGMEMARLGTGIGMRVLGWTRRASPDRQRHGLVRTSLEELFAGADVVTLHLSYREETHGLISRSLLVRMKPEAYFVNTARPKLVDNAALVELLRAGKLAGAAIDVHDEEPPRDDYVFRTLPNVLITPHIGFNTREAGANMLRIAVETLEAFTRGERLHVVN